MTRCFIVWGFSYQNSTLKFLHLKLLIVYTEIPQYKIFSMVRYKIQFLFLLNSKSLTSDSHLTLFIALSSGQVSQWKKMSHIPEFFYFKCTDSVLRVDCLRLLPGTHLETYCLANHHATHMSESMHVCLIIFKTNDISLETILISLYDWPLRTSYYIVSSSVGPTI